MSRQFGRVAKAFDSRSEGSGVNSRLCTQAIMTWKFNQARAWQFGILGSLRFTSGSLLGNWSQNQSFSKVPSLAAESDQNDLMLSVTPAFMIN